MSEGTTSDEDKGAPSSLRRIEPGDVLAEKYRVVQVLGEGGMGIVLEALHLELDQKVAIKCLLPHMAKSEEHVSRFTREAKVLAKLQSEHVARVYDVGKLDNGLPYMVMEYLEGCDLREYVDKNGPLALHEAAELALQACAGLADVHAAGIVHRDLKPSNCYVVQRGDGAVCLKLLDFGISKFQGAAITRTAAIMGSPGYMSPEQMTSTKDVDERADIWALGATLYEMLTARPAFIAENAPMLCIKIASEEPEPPRNSRADIPDQVEKIVLRCLAKKPEARYSTVAEVALALAPYAPERAQPYVEKIDGILRGGRSAPRVVRQEAATANVHDKATARSGPSAYAKTQQEGRRPPPPRGRGRLMVFVMGSLLGAGVAAAYFGDVQKIRAQIGSVVELPTPTPTPPPTPTPTPTPSPTPIPSPTSSPSLAPTPFPPSDLLDASADAFLDDDAGDDDDDDDAGSASVAEAGPTSKPAAPAKKKPHPTRPVHKRPRRK